MCHYVTNVAQAERPQLIEDLLAGMGPEGIVEGSALAR